MSRELARGWWVLPFAAIGALMWIVGLTFLIRWMITL